MISSLGNNKASNLAVSSQISTAVSSRLQPCMCPMPIVVNPPAQLCSIEGLWVHSQEENESQIVVTASSLNQSAHQVAAVGPQD